MRVKIIEVRPEIASKKKRVCAYCRVSTDSLKQEDSLENQTATYERIIKENPEYEFAGVYADQGISGFSENRPSFQSMIERARGGEIDLIITKSISRLARNTVTVLKTARDLKELGVGIFFEEQNINTLSGDGEMMLAVLASFAQEESRSMSENNKWSIRKRFERGEFMINTTRFLGYDKNESGNLVINQKEAEIVRFIFDLYLMGIGSFRLADLLRVLKVPTVSKAEWGDSAINGMLQNEKYKGDFHLQKYFTPEHKRNSTKKNRGEVKSYYVTDNHAAIISPEKWEKVQELRQKRKEERSLGVGDTAKYQNKYPLSGMLICPYCGKNLRRRQVYNKRIQWICATYLTKGKNACMGIRVDEDELLKHSITEPTIIEEMRHLGKEQNDGKKHYRYTSKREFDTGTGQFTENSETSDGGILQSVDRSRRTAIKL